MPIILNDYLASMSRNPYILIVNTLNWIRRWSSSIIVHGIEFVNSSRLLRCLTNGYIRICCVSTHFGHGSSEVGSLNLLTFFIWVIRSSMIVSDDDFLTRCLLTPWNRRYFRTFSSLFLKRNFLFCCQFILVRQFHILFVGHSIIIFLRSSRKIRFV